ncbi:MAG: DNA polymerase Y family protein [Bradyrhizobiaceae bacterium]|nr:DNA polymerase Y family protein [Bradyrhizobiaceae bacterium]
MRIVSVWLPRWPILRFLTAQKQKPSAEPVDPKRPFVLAVEAAGGPRIAALNEAAEAEGLAKQDLVADARAKAGVLQVRDIDPVADDAALKRLALWATRYTPLVSPWGEANGADGFFLDITGAAHLFGGEDALLADLAKRLHCFGLPAQLAVADTAGAAWALSQFHSSSTVILPSGQEAEALSPLPVEALRLSFDTWTTLRRLGFKRVGTLIDKPRAPFAARFEKELLLRLDQALGRAPEPLTFVNPPPVYHSARYLLEPIFTTDAVVAFTARLMRDLAHALVRDGVGARALRLSLYRVDSVVETIDLGLTLPTRSAAHVARLIGLKLERLAGAVDAGFGFEALDLAVTTAEPMEAQQTELVAGDDDSFSPEQCAALVDRLQQRLGSGSVQRLAPVESHLPERAETFEAVRGDAPAWPSPDASRLRPPILLSRAEEVKEVMAIVPEGPPARFRWRGTLHDVAHAQGPERIANEWWLDRGNKPTRDYYLVEGKAGHRFWLYREGLYERETRAPRWFMHGLFA